MVHLVDSSGTGKQLDHAWGAQKTAVNEKQWLQERISFIYVELAKCVVKRPWTTLLVEILVTLICFAGIFSPNMIFESKAENLWVPTDSLAYKNFVYNNEVYGSTYRNSVLVQPAGSAGTVLNQLLTKAVFDELWVLDSKVRSIQLPSDGRNFSEICTLVAGKCSVFSPLLFWSDQTSYETSVFTDTDVIAAASASTFANGFPVSRLSLFGKFKEDSNTGTLTEAYGTSIFYQLDSMKVSSAEAQEFEDIFLASLGLRDAPSNPVMYQIFDALYIQVYGDRSLDAELARVITIDMPLVVVEYLIMYVFIVCALSWGEKSIRAGLAAGTVMSCVASIMAAYGIIAACGVPITSLIFILPFILVGIGVDDAFVIVAAYKQVELSESEVAAALSSGSDVVGAKLTKALERCGLSITYTTLTDVAAFSLGCTAAIPAVRYFCAYAAAAVAADFLYQVTFFLAVFAIDERRIAAGVKTCCGARDGDDSGGGSFVCRPYCGARVSTSETKAPATPNADILGASNDKRRRFDLAKRYIAVVTSPGGATGIVLTFFLFTCMCSWFATKLGNDFRLSEIVPDNSYARDYYAAATKLDLYWDTTIPYNVLFKILPFVYDVPQDGADMADPDVQANAKDLLVQLLNNTEKSKGPLSWWLDDYLAWVPYQSTLSGYLNDEGYFDGSTSAEGAAAFENSVATFLSTYPYDRYSSEVAFWDDGSIRSSRASLYHFDTAGADNKIEAMVASYEKCEASPLGTSKAITFAQPYIFITQFMVITSETLQNLICSFVAVSILSWVVLYDVRAVGAVLLCLAAIDVDLLGLLWAWGLELNSVTMISLVMAIGLVVDYLAHLVHCFICHTAEYPDPRERMAAALAEVGGAVALGGLTTFIGVLPLAFASSFIYRVFFRLFICIVGLGLIHGFFVIPVLVYLAYPSTTAKDDANEATFAGIPGEQLKSNLPENDAEQSTL